MTPVATVHFDGLPSMVIQWELSLASNRTIASDGALPDRKSTRLNSSHAKIYTLPLHDALPIYDAGGDRTLRRLAVHGHPVGIILGVEQDNRIRWRLARSEEHTSELQSRQDLHSSPTRRSSDL